jgi:hypothetical protein
LRVNKLRTAFTLALALLVMTTVEDLWYTGEWEIVGGG